MRSSSLKKQLVATSDKIVWHTEDAPAELTIFLDSAASGETQFGFSASGGMQLVPGGTPVKVTVAPNTDIFVTTTATTAVKVDLLITDLPRLTAQDDLVGCVQKLGELIAFIFADVIERRQNEIRGTGPAAGAPPRGGSLRGGSLGPLTDRMRRR